MGFLRGIGRAAPLLAAGLATGWYLRRQGLLGGPAHTELPSPGEPIEAHVEAVEAVSDAADVTAVVEDLLAVAPAEEQEIVDAEVVDEGESDLAGAVRVELAEAPSLLSPSVEIEAGGGVVWLRGELDRPEAIAEAERRAALVAGVAEVRNLLHLPGTPPPSR